MGGLLYSTTTGNTETVAGYVSAKTGLEAADIADCDAETIGAFDALIVGAPTWHTGADSERSGTAWDEFIYGDLTYRPHGQEGGHLRRRRLGWLRRQLLRRDGRARYVLQEAGRRDRGRRVDGRL